MRICDKLTRFFSPLHYYNNQSVWKKIDTRISNWWWKKYIHKKKVNYYFYFFIFIETNKKRNTFYYIQRKFISKRVRTIPDEHLSPTRLPQRRGNSIMEFICWSVDSARTDMRSRNPFLHLCRHSLYLLNLG